MLVDDHRLQGKPRLPQSSRDFPGGGAIAKQKASDLALAKQSGDFLRDLSRGEYSLMQHLAIGLHHGHPTLVSTRVYGENAIPGGGRGKSPPTARLATGSGHGDCPHDLTQAAGSIRSSTFRGPMVQVSSAARAVTLAGPLMLRSLSMLAKRSS